MAARWVAREVHLRRTVGLYAEIVATLAFLLGAALLLGGFLLLRLTEQQLLDQRVAKITSQIKVMSRLPGILADPESDPVELLAGLGRALRELPPDPAPLAWSLVDRTLAPVAVRQLAGEGIDDPGDLRQALVAREPLVRVGYRVGWLPWKAEEGSLLITQPVVYQGTVIGALQARFSLADVRLQVLDSYRLTLLYILLYGAVLVGMGVLLLSRNVIRPVQRLRLATQRIAGGDLDGRLPETGPKETADLANAFNTMVTALRESRAETEAHIASLQQANDEIRRTQQELVRSEKMASVGHLAAGMAHEVGNPLAAVVGYLELLKSTLPPGADRDLVERSLTELGRIDRLVRDLLDFAASEPAGTEKFAPAEVLREAADILSHQGAFGGRDIRWELAPDLPPIAMSRHKLLQVLVNLLLNARDATDEDGILRLTAGRAGKDVSLAVGDNGAGIAPADRQHLFDPFFTTKAPGQGRGLGLSVSLRVIEEAGGRILVDSTPGQGTVFTVLLPPASEGMP